MEKSLSVEGKIGQLADQAVERFCLLTRYYALFHMGFFALGFGQLLILLLFFPFFSKSSLLAFLVAALFFTAFSYFVLRFYFQAKKPQQLEEIRGEFIEACGRILPTSVPMTHAVYRLIDRLRGQESQYYRLPKYLETLSPLVQKLSLWFHWQDVHQMKELLHGYCIQERLRFVKTNPTDLDTHAALARAYIALNKEYIDPGLFGFISQEYASEEMQNKFKKSAERALEELKILDTYAPKDPWVYSQLAALYHDLEMPEKELEACETLIRLSPQDRDLLLRCGILYFRQGQAAQALRIYEQLKKARDPKAEELISAYTESIT